MFGSSGANRCSSVRCPPTWGYKGYLTSAVLFGAAIAATAAAWRFLGASPVATFWIAYVLTRPMGASIGDFLSQPSSKGGLGLGTTTTSEVFLGMILALVVYLTATKRDQIAPTVEAR
jgi:uncharacterized membrane-anchored protein